MSRAQTSDRERGQNLVEFSMLVPVFLILLLGMLEFGLAFSHNQTLVYSTREGARTGAALAKGNTSYPCTTPNFDAPVIAAVQRVLESPGSPIQIGKVSEILIYRANSDGTPSSAINRWALNIGGGPTVDGKALNFKETSTGWAPCTRNNGVDADAMGVSLAYTYDFETSLGGVLAMISGTSWTSLPMTDKTVMNLNPTTP